jgi:hypothetical protein
MKIEINNLITVTNFAILKGITRQHVYRLIESKLINSVSIDGILFIVKDKIAEDLQRQRKERVRKL